MRDMLTGALTALLVITLSACVTSLHLDCVQDASGGYICDQNSVVGI
jgi:hypothetical protein